MFDLINSQIDHSSQIDYSKDNHCHSSPWPLVKNTCVVVKKTHLINLVNLKNKNFSNV
jgi:hypothetical protein